MLDFLSTLWHEQTSFAWWQACLIALLALLVNGGACAANWFVRKETILECGYRKATAKRMRKIMKKWTWAERIILRRLAKEATQSSPMIGLSLFLNYLNLLCGGIVLIGFACSIATCGAGWAMGLAFLPGLLGMFFSTVVTFIPDLLWVPSERKRYSIKGKK